MTVHKFADWIIYDCDTTKSTNDDALAFNMGNADKVRFVFTAKQQTNGRGRFDHKWDSCTGNLFFSAILPCQAEDSGMLALLCGYTVLQTIKKYNNRLNICLKWPNDVLIDNKKVCGILIERKDDDYVVAGIGVNIAVAPELAGARYEATTLRDYQITTDRLDFLAEFLNIFNEGLEKLKKREFNSIKNDWLHYAKGLNSDIAIDSCGKIIQGRFVDIDDSGALILDDGNKKKVVFAGDIYFERE